MLAPEGSNQKVLPWIGGSEVYGEKRTWRISGRRPAEPGWYTFDISGGRKARLLGEAEPDLDYEQGRKTLRGYLVGNRLIPDGVRVTADPNQTQEQTREVHLVEPGLDRFARALVAERQDGRLIYVRQEFPLGPEVDVERAYQDRLDSLDGIKNVTPGLDLAFRWLAHQRAIVEERRRELERQRAEEDARRQAEERMRQLRENLSNPEARRQLAVQDFEAAAEAALALSNSKLLDTRPAFRDGEAIVIYRVRGLRMECIVDRATLRIVDAGMCLKDHATQEQGDRRFTLETLPSVVEEAIDRFGAPHIWAVGRE